MIDQIKFPRFPSQLVLACRGSLPLWSLLVAAFFFSGCSGGTGDELLPASGTVTRGGQPLVGAIVTFMPKDGEGAPSGGKTDEQGHFSLTYNDGRAGAVPAQHRVVITIPGTEPPPPTGGEQVKMPQDDSEEFSEQADVQASGENVFSFEVGG